MTTETDQNEVGHGSVDPCGKRARIRTATSLGALSLAATMLAIAACSAQDGPPLNLDDYRLTFSDEFDAIDVSRLGPGTRWIAHTPWNGDFGDAKFADPRPGFPFTVKDGILQIEARRNEVGKWESGLISGADTKGEGFSQQYGYFEMRAKLPAGPGVWPAFWLIGVETLKKDPQYTAEIDILEYYGHDPSSFQSAIHVWPKVASVERFTKIETIKVEPNSLTNDYRLYGATVDADKIRVYLDRKEVWSIDTPATHHQPMFMLVNLALGSGWPIENTPNPSFMLVDYVRAYARKQPAP